MHIDKSKPPAASVLLPVYNADRHVEAAVESVLRQSFTDFELLLLNDGSTDDSAARLARFAARDGRCRLHSWPNRGLIATLNEGIRLAAADIVIRMDADDICYPRRFERQVAYLRAHPECVALGSRVMLIDAEGETIAEMKTDCSHQAIDAAHLAGKGGAIPHPASAMRRQALLEVGGYRPEYRHAEDIDLFLRLAEVGQLANLPEVLLAYRQHADSIGYRHAQGQRDSARRAIRAAAERRGIPCPAAGGDDAGGEAPSLADIHRKWAWWALAAGNLATARKHALRAFRLEPFGRKNGKLLACVARGY